MSPTGGPFQDDELLQDSWGTSFVSQPGEELAAVVSQSQDDAGEPSNQEAGAGSTEGAGNQRSASVAADESRQSKAAAAVGSADGQDSSTGKA